MREPDAGSSMKYMWIVYTLHAEILTLWLSIAKRGVGWRRGDNKSESAMDGWMDRIERQSNQCIFNN